MRITKTNASPVSTPAPSPVPAPQPVSAAQDFADRMAALEELEAIVASAPPVPAPQGEPTAPHCLLCTEGMGDHTSPTLEHPEPVKTVRELVEIPYDRDEYGPLQIERVSCVASKPAPEGDEPSVHTHERVCAKCGKWVYWDNGDVTYNCICSGRGWKWVPLAAYQNPHPAVREAVAQALCDARYPVYPRKLVNGFDPVSGDGTNYLALADAAIAAMGSGKSAESTGDKTSPVQSSPASPEVGELPYLKPTAEQIERARAYAEKSVPDHKPSVGELAFAARVIGREDQLLAAGKTIEKLNAKLSALRQAAEGGKDLNSEEGGKI